MKIKLTPNLDVVSVSEYFSIPKGERTWFGLYQLPATLPIESFNGELGWNFFYNEIKKEFPIQWFFRYWIFSFENPIYNSIKRIAWKIFPPRDIA